MAIKSSLKVVAKLLFLKDFGQFSEPQSLILIHFVDEFHCFFSFLSTLNYYVVEHGLGKMQCTLWKQTLA